MILNAQPKKNQVPTVVLTRVPFAYQSYFQWFLTGLYLLEAEKKLNVKSEHIGLFRYLSMHINSELACLGLIFFEGKLLSHIKSNDNYCLTGYLIQNSRKIYFCMDCADAPFCFDSKLLDKVNVYFKMQCPKTIDKGGFPLTPKVIIPYCDITFEEVSLLNKGSELRTRKLCNNIFENINKIKPAMLGIRSLSFSNSRKMLIKSYISKVNHHNIDKQGKAMCYFGSSRGPRTTELSGEALPDYLNESDIMGYYNNKLHHPNEKRAKVTKILQSLGSQYDARLIREGFADSKEGIEHLELVIPLRKFAEHVSHFEYNINISGYRMSIPNRFTDSFMVGTAIFTDKLLVKWYKPFDKKEVIETIPMGYLPERDVDWNTWEHDLLNLPSVNRNEILNLFYEKWAPDSFAKYVIETIQASTESDKND